MLQRRKPASSGCGRLRVSRHEMSGILSRFEPASPFFAPSLLYKILSSPITFLARSIYRLLCVFRLSPAPRNPPIRVVCISDSHTQTRDIPGGDLLIHAGDLCNTGSVAELQRQIEWLGSLPHTHKVVIAGNHDAYLDPRSRKTLGKAEVAGGVDWKSLHYLQHRSVRLSFPDCGGRSLCIYGAPQVPALGGHEHAFQYARGQDAWTETVPSDADILVTHTPPKWHLDLPAGLGCEWLLRECRRVRPRLHVCGHVHADRGRLTMWFDGSQEAYERICWRDAGPVAGFIDPRNWVDMGLLLLSGIKGCAWRILWGGSASGTILVNAALISNDTGGLDHAAEVVEI